MPFRLEEEFFTEEDIDDTLTSMRDSVRLVNDYVSGNAPSRMHPTRVRDTIKRNVEHLEIMVNKRYIKNSERNLSEFTDAISAGNTFLYPIDPEL